MAVDKISQVVAAPPRVAPARQPAAGAATARQELPGRGETLPPTPAAELTQVVGRLNDYVQTLRRDLVFRVDKDTDKVMVTVVDPESGEVIRQIPPEEVMAVARALGQIQQGLLLNTKI
jgi:flagellar protein FlaG